MNQIPNIRIIPPIKTNTYNATWTTERLNVFHCCYSHNKSALFSVRTSKNNTGILSTFYFYQEENEKKENKSASLLKGDGSK